MDTCVPGLHLKAIKRDGTIQEFDISKPIEAFRKPFTEGLKREVPEGLEDKFKKELDEFLQDLRNQKVEQIEIERIQDFIRDFLVQENESEAAENFILYREKRSEYREKKTKLYKNIATKLYAKNVENSNANVDEASFGGRIGEAANVVTCDYALKNSMSKMARRNHENNLVYIHDLNSYAAGMHNCLTKDIDKSLSEGFMCRQADVRPAKSISTAMQLVAVDFQCQSLEQFGGVAAGHIDWSMVPYFRNSFYKHYKEVAEDIPFCYGFAPSLANPSEISISDEVYTNGWFLKKWIKKYIRKRALKRTKTETHQAIEGLFHNLNTLNLWRAA